MLLQRLNRLFLFLRGEVCVDVHGHGWVGVTEEILDCFHIHPGIIEHSGVGMAKLVSSEPGHSDNRGRAPASFLPVIALCAVACCTQSCYNVGDTNSYREAVDITIP